MMDTSSGWLATDTIREASMEQNVISVGIDVDDVRYHGSALEKRTGEVLDFESRPPLKAEGITATWWCGRVFLGAVGNR